MSLILSISMITLQLDTNVPINLIEKKGFAKKFSKSLRGKKIRVGICDVVLSELKKVRGYSKDFVITKISHILGRPVVVSSLSVYELKIATEKSEKFSTLHRNDDLILAHCFATNSILITCDRKLRHVCDIAGVVAVHPMGAGRI